MLLRKTKRPSTLTERNVRLSNLVISSCFSDVTKVNIIVNAQNSEKLTPYYGNVTHNLTEYSHTGCQHLLSLSDSADFHSFTTSTKFRPATLA